MDNYLLVTGWGILMCEAGLVTCHRLSGPETDDHWPGVRSQIIVWRLPHNVGRPLSDDKSLWRINRLVKEAFIIYFLLVHSRKTSKLKVAMEFPLLGCISLEDSIAPSQKTEMGNSSFDFCMGVELYSIKVIHWHHYGSRLDNTLAINDHLCRRWSRLGLLK